MSSSILTVKERLMPRGALKRLETQDTLDYEKFKSDMDWLATKIERKRLAVSSNEKLEIEELIRTLKHNSLNEKLKETEVISADLASRNKVDQNLTEEANAIYADYKLSRKRSKIKSELLFDALGKQGLFIAILLTNLILIGLYLYYKIYIPDYGMDTRMEFYTVVAQILPALLIALFLTQKGEIEYEQREKPSFARSLLSGYKFLGLVAFSIGELACLWAIQRGHTGLGVYLFAMFGLLMLMLVAFSKIVRIARDEDK
jgi:hypothetical protein